MMSDEESVRLINLRHEIFLRNPIKSVMSNKDVPASVFGFRIWIWSDIKIRSRDKFRGVGRVKDPGSKIYMMTYRSY